jgi:lysophospholipase L1-like esterase
MFSTSSSQFFRHCTRVIAATTAQRPQLAFFSTQPAEESALRKTLLKYRANASKSRDKSVKQAYMQLANDIQAKLNTEAAASNDTSRQASVKQAAAVEVNVAGSSKTGVPALKIRLPSSFKPSAGDKSKSRKP